MKNGLKKALFCLASLTASSAFAGNALDGAFQCTVSSPGSATINVGLAVTTNSQGQTGAAPIALASTNAIYGYGLGTVGTSTFTGSTNGGQPFNFAFNPQTLSFSGTVGATGSSATTLTCSKVF